MADTNTHEHKEPRPVIRANGKFAKGTGRLPNAGTKPGTKLRRLESVIADLEVKLGRNCDPVQTLVELAAGHDELATQALRRFDKDDIDAVLETPGWRVINATDLRTKAKYRHLNPEVVLALKALEVPRDVQIDAAKAASRFVRPILAQTAVTGPEGGPVQMASFPVSELMGKDDAVKLIEEMQIAMAGRVRQSLSQQVEAESDEDKE